MYVVLTALHDQLANVDRHAFAVFALFL